MKQKVVKCAQSNHLSFYFWGSHLPNGSIDHKQLSGDTLGVQIYIPDRSGYSAYEKVKSELAAIFETYEIYFDEEIDLPTKSGWFKELHFMSKVAYQEKCEKGEAMASMSTGHVYNIGTINAQGGNVVFGDVVNSTFSIDNSVTKIEEMIEEKGGEDKAELLTVLEEVKAIAEQISATGKIETKPSLRERLSRHLEKHSWFYGEIVGLLGSVALKLTLGI
ncbi:MAG: hypothetical protein VB085_07880 [Peptococcaceae bacterium]|nr:hypothetical protein [Peptococcaceae bacterium]